MDEWERIAEPIEDSGRELIRTRDTGEYRDRTSALNRRILAHNLKTPSDAFNLRAVIRRSRSGGSTTRQRPVFSQLLQIAEPLGHIGQNITQHRQRSHI